MNTHSVAAGLHPVSLNPFLTPSNLPYTLVNKRMSVQQGNMRLLARYAPRPLCYSLMLLIKVISAGSQLVCMRLLAACAY